MPGVGLDYLFRRVGLVEARVRALVAHRRQDDPNPEDPFRGLYLSDEAADRLLRPGVPPPPVASADRHRVEGAQPTRQLRRSRNRCRA